MVGKAAPPPMADLTDEFVDAVAPPAVPGDVPLTVSDLLLLVKDALAAGLPRRISVVGEISNLKRQSSGHLYFCLKDGRGQISCVMFRSAAGRLKFDPQDGLEVVADGRVDIYDMHGKLQVYVESLAPKGAGALELAFRQLVARLQAEGLFDPAHKKPIPPYPQTIAVITSPTGAAVRDIARTLRRRWPAAEVYLLPVKVQGDGAAEEIARALRLASANAKRYGFDVLILARGGGSLEDLWCFNEEVVARAIHACCIPVISGVGHETDTTIADLVADLRAPTPTGAAELATPDAADLRRHLAQLTAHLRRRAEHTFAEGRSALRLVERAEFFRNPIHRVQTLEQHADELATRLRSALIQCHARSRERADALAGSLRWQLGALAKRAGDRLGRATARLAGANPMQTVRVRRCDVDLNERQLRTLTRALVARLSERLERDERVLEAMSYRSVLRRGYSVTRTGEGAIVRAPADAPPGTPLRTELAEGEVRSTVDGAAEAAATPPAPSQPAPARPAHPHHSGRRRPRKPTWTEDEPGLFEEWEPDLDHEP